MNLTKNDLKNLIKSLEVEGNIYLIKQKEKDKRIKSNMKALYKKARELNKDVPDELSIHIWMDSTISTSIFEKYKEWFE